MSPKEQQLLAKLCERFESGTFSELDVSCLLTLLRDSVGNGPVRELAQHIAHRERNSGAFFHRIRDNKRALDKLGKKPGRVVSGDVFSSVEFAHSLNGALTRFGMRELGAEITDLVFLCGLSLMQGTRVSDGRTSFGELSMCLTAERFLLCAQIAVKHDRRAVPVIFVVLSVSNHWLPVCNPRATIEAANTVSVSVARGIPIIDGYKPFQVYVERDPPITESELVAGIAADTRLSRPDAQSVCAIPAGRGELALRWDGKRLIVPGRPEYFAAGSEYVDILRSLSRRLGACVHDDARAHWFLESPHTPLPPDGFHCHWVGRGSATCNMPT